MEPKCKLKTAPVIFPAALADLKRNLHIDITDVETDRDTLLQDLLDAAITASQNNTGRQYCRATYTGYLDDYPEDDEVLIKLGPVAAISSVKYYAPGASELTTLNSSKYQLDNIDLTARLKFLESFSVDQDRLNAIEVEFTNGWATAAEVPKDLKQAIILRATEGYLNPENAAAPKYLTAAENKERDYKVQRY
jgi:uncharacterized phiE125 gp8 family phage protein